jgi:alginate O-acetyltransferase complex protein AlgI
MGKQVCRPGGMLFNSAAFLVFFPLVYAIYLAMAGRFRAQNVVLLIASWIFYGWWDWRFLSLIWLSTIVDYVVALRIQASPDDRRRRRWLMLSLVTNLGALGVFKYFDFFSRSLAAALSSLGIDAEPFLLEVVLPVGISFYTFQTLSYSIDVYRRRIPPCRDLIGFALYVAFFPQLVAGPIERAGRLLQQIEGPRQITTDQLQSGLWLAAWGFFKKMVLADNMARIADPVFADPSGQAGLDLVLGALAFTLQIYADFSGYSDIARGIAKLMGFELVVNFKIPYVAASPSDFWRRWHISLSQWLRDYLYISLGGNRGTRLATARNLVLTMLLGGLWHGAAWNFVVWGAFHGALLVAYRPLESVQRFRWLRVPIMFGFTILGWIIFRSASLADIGTFLTQMGPTPSSQSLRWIVMLAAGWFPLIVVEAWQHRTGDLLAPLEMPWPLKGLTLAGLVAATLVLGVRKGGEFIYFQF